MKHLLFLLISTISIVAHGQIPYLQTFDGPGIPVDWTQVDNTNPQSGQIWEVGTAGSWDNIPALTGNYAVLNSDGYGEGGTQNADLISPTFDCSGVSLVNLRFNHFYYKFQSSTATLSYSIDNGTNWVVIKTWDSSSTNPEIFNQIIAAAAGQSQVKFKWNYTGDYEWGWAIDDVSVTETSLVVWTGATSTDWHTPGNWAGGVIPSAGSIVTIPSLANKPEIQQDADCLNLTISLGATVTIKPQKSLTVYNALTNNTVNGLVIESDATGTGSLIVGAIAGSGTAEVQLYMTGNQWHNVSSPVTQPISDFLLNNASVPTNGASRGMADFDIASDGWNPYFTDASTGDFEIAKGYILRNNPSGTVKFNGAINTGEQIISLLSDGNGWNLIGNPFTSAISLNDDAGINNFLTYNNSSINASYFGVYVWNGTDYDIINNASGAEFATVGQGFFVKNTEASTANFTRDMQVHQPTVPLKSGVLVPEIKLLVSSAKKSVSTEIKFFKDATAGLDKGFDAGIFKADPSFSVFTHLIDDNNIEFALQCLPSSTLESLTIPVGIDFSAGGEVIFSAQLLNLAAGSNIILEDRLLNIFTSMNDEKSAYKTSLAAGSKGTGRFYLHVSANQTTGVGNDAIANKINAWIDRDEIVIKGITENKAVATLFDVRGSLILKKDLDNSATNRINVNGINTGIYMLQVLENGKRTGIKLQISEN